MAFDGFDDKLESDEIILWSGEDISQSGREQGNHYAITNQRIHIYTHNRRSLRKEGAGTHYTTVAFQQIGTSQEDALGKGIPFFVIQQRSKLVFCDIDDIALWEWSVPDAPAVLERILKQMGVASEQKEAAIEQSQSFFEEKAILKKELDKKTKSLLDGTEKKVYYQARYHGGIYVKFAFEFFAELAFVLGLVLIAFSAADEMTMVAVLMFSGLAVLLLWMMRWRVLLARTYCVITNNAIHIYKNDRDYTSVRFLKLLHDSTVEIEDDVVRVTTIKTYLDPSPKLKGKFGIAMDKLSERVIEFRRLSPIEQNELYDLIQYIINTK